MEQNIEIQIKNTNENTNEIKIVKPLVLNNEEINFNTIQQNLTKIKTQMMNGISDIQQQLRMLEKQYKQLKKEETKEAKEAREAKKNGGDIKPQKKITGFNISEKMSNELCDFMKLPHNSERSRTEITKYILEYINTNKLQDNTERKYIKMNDELKTLFKLENIDKELSYFNIHKYINKHICEKKI